MVVRDESGVSKKETLLSLNDHFLLTTRRTCCKCGLSLSLAHFSKRKDGGLGRSYICQDCNNARVKKWKRSQRELRRESLA